MAYCTHCGKEHSEDANFCIYCGARVDNNTPVVQTSHEIINKTKKAKKKKFPGVLKALIVLLVIAGICLSLWFSFGNMITLTHHSKIVAETLNSGSMDIPGAESAYSKQPDYVKALLDEDAMKQYGPVTEAMLPYINAKVGKVHGLFGGNRVEYIISAPDAESWLLSYPVTNKTTGEKMLKDLEEYVKTAPMRTVSVVVEYYRPGFFSLDWEGNYYTSEFADAVCGGLNSAYNKLYKDFMAEVEALYE